MVAKLMSGVTSKSGAHSEFILAKYLEPISTVLSNAVVAKPSAVAAARTGYCVATVPGA